LWEEWQEKRRGESPNTLTQKDKRSPRRHQLRATAKRATPPRCAPVGSRRSPPGPRSCAPISIFDGTPERTTASDTSRRARLSPDSSNLHLRSTRLGRAHIRVADYVNRLREPHALSRPRRRDPPITPAKWNGKYQNSEGFSPAIRKTINGSHVSAPSQINAVPTKGHSQYSGFHPHRRDTDLRRAG
jgi:hypothetical protein